MSKDLEKLIFLHEQKMHFKGRNPNFENEDEEERNENFRNSFPQQKDVSPVLPDPTSSSNDDYSVAVTEDGIWFKCQFCGTFLEGQNKLEFHESKCQCRPVKDKEAECEEEKMKAQDLENKALFTEHGIWYKCQHCGAFLKGKTKLLNHQSKCQPPPPPPSSSSQEDVLIEALDDNDEPGNSPENETTSASLPPPPPSPKKKVRKRRNSERTSSMQDNQSKDNSKANSSQENDDDDTFVDFTIRDDDEAPGEMEMSQHKLLNHPSKNQTSPSSSQENDLVEVPDDNNEPKPRKSPEKETVRKKDPSELSSSSSSSLPPPPLPPPKKNVLKSRSSRRTSSTQDNHSKFNCPSSQENYSSDTFVDLSIRADEKQREMVTAQKNSLSHQNMSNKSPENGDLIEVPDQPLAPGKSWHEELVARAKVSSDLSPPPPKKKASKHRSSSRRTTTPAQDLQSKSKDHSSQENKDTFLDFTNKVISRDDVDAGQVTQTQLSNHQSKCNRSPENGDLIHVPDKPLAPGKSLDKEVVVRTTAKGPSDLSSSSLLPPPRNKKVPQRRSSRRTTTAAVQNRPSESNGHTSQEEEFIICDDEPRGLDVGEETMLRNDPVLYSSSKSGPKENDEVSCQPCQSPKREVIVDDDNLSLCESEFTSSKRLEETQVLQIKYNRIEDGEINLTFGDFRTRDTDTADKSGETSGLATTTTTKKTKNPLNLLSSSSSSTRKKKTVKRRSGRHRACQTQRQVQQSNPSLTSKEPEQTSEALTICDESVEEGKRSESKNDHGRGTMDSTMKSLSTGKTPKRLKGTRMQPSRSPKPELVKGGSDCNLLQTVLSKEIRIHISPVDTSLLKIKPSSSDLTANPEMIKDPLVTSQEKEDSHGPQQSSSSLKQSSSSSESIPKLHLRRSCKTDPRRAGISLQENGQEKVDVPQNSSLKSSSSSSKANPEIIKDPLMSSRNNTLEKEDDHGGDSSLKPPSSSSSESVPKRHLQRSSKTDPRSADINLQKNAQEKEDVPLPQDSSSSSSSESIPKRNLRRSSRTDPRSADINLQKNVQENENVPQDSSLKSSSSEEKTAKRHVRRSSETDPRSADIDLQKKAQEKDDVPLPLNSSLKSCSSSSNSIPNRHLRRSSETDPKSAGISLQKNAKGKDDVPQDSSLNSSTSSNSIPKRHLRRSSKTNPDPKSAGISLQKKARSKDDSNGPQDSSLKSSSSQEKMPKRHPLRSCRTDPNPISAVEPEVTNPGFDLPEAKIMLKRLKVPRTKSTRIKIPSTEKKSLFAYSKKATKPKEFSLKNKNQIKKKSAQKYHSKNFSCDYLNCDKKFPSRFHLELHVRSHTGERPFKCKYKKCKKSFSQITNLRNHERTHTGEKPYMCHWCKKCFSQIANLKHHERLHTGVMPYKCEICGKKFAQQSTWGGHMKANHKELQMNREK